MVGVRTKERGTEEGGGGRRRGESRKGSDWREGRRYMYGQRGRKGGGKRRGNLAPPRWSWRVWIDSWNCHTAWWSSLL